MSGLMIFSYYDELYVGASTRRTEKYEWAMRAFGAPVATFSTKGHELHRIRRSVLAPFFSKASVAQLEPTVQAVIAKFISRLKELQGSHIPVNLIDAYSALTNDVRNCVLVSVRAFGLSCCRLSPNMRFPLLMVSWTHRISRRGGTNACWTCWRLGIYSSNFLGWSP